MKLLYTLVIAVLLLFAASCETAPKYDRTLFEGAWKCATLFSDGVENVNPQTIIFDFKLDSTYNYTGGSYTETGTWYLEGDKLVTIAEGDLEKKVQIEKITADTMVMKMNDRGTDMTLILLPQE